MSSTTEQKEEKKEKKEKPEKANSNLPSQSKKFEIQKDNSLIYNPTTNYYQEYWKTFYDNEYLLAQIKENAYEINSMKAHIDELNKN